MTDHSELAGAVERIAGTRVLVVGDVILDRFITGSVDRISPEAPIPVLRIEDESVMLGGAGNVLRNLVALGAKAKLMAVIGEDAAGAEIARLVAELSGGDEDLVRNAAHPTTIKERYLAGGQQLLRTDRESAAALSPTTTQALAERAAEMLEAADALVLSDYGKGVLTAEVIARLIARARVLGVPVTVDPKANDFARYDGADLVTPNRQELEDAVGLPASSDGEVAVACERLLGAVDIGTVVATRGPQGMSLGCRSSNDGGLAVHHLPAVAREVFDVSGAGDTVAAVLGAAQGAGLDLLEAARLANVAAGVVVGKVGTAAVRPAELLQALHSSDLLIAEDKVVDADSLLETVTRWRRTNLKVGLTNGCFDLLHPGHMTLLKRARAACDRLIVALNSDASVRRLKGPARPIQTEAARAVVLASLTSVDRVVVFAEDTPLKLIEAVQPDVLVKGADYRREEVVGADQVESHGGEVLLVPIEEGHSTSATIDKLVDADSDRPEDKSG